MTLLQSVSSGFPKTSLPSPPPATPRQASPPVVLLDDGRPHHGQHRFNICNNCDTLVNIRKTNPQRQSLPFPYSIALIDSSPLGQAHNVLKDSGAEDWNILLTLECPLCSS